MQHCQHNNRGVRGTEVDGVRKGVQERTSHVKITIDRWSSEDERRQLASAFRQGGPYALLGELKKIKLGRIDATDRIGHDLRYAQQVPLPTGGRHILIAADGPLSFWDPYTSVEYPFVVVEIRVDAKGRGEGKLTMVTKVTAFGETMTFEDYDVMPVKLSSVRARRK